MTYAFDSKLGEQLYQILPEVYRTRDKTSNQVAGDSGNEDLARYLDAHGHLLDLIHATLRQQHDDALPESSQDWLLPYFADLLAANMVSPDSEGRHAEIVNAVSWRQRKGTIKCAEEIAEAVGQMEVEIQEGWKRVAKTPRIGMPLMSAKVWDDSLNIDMTIPSEAVRHPSLPAVMVDLRRPSRAVESDITNPATRVSSFAGIKQSWRQANLHGVPCFPDSFDDVSLRTVDIRTPDVANGHYHHKRLLAYTPPPAGLFPFEPIQITWAQRNDSLYAHLIEEKEENGVCYISNMTDRVVVITDEVVLSPAMSYHVKGLHFSTKLSVDNGGRIELHRVVATEVQVDTPDTDEPVLTASDCLFDELSVGSGAAKLDSCTILTKTFLNHIDAVDCLFMDMTGTAISGVIQYSRIPDSPPISSDKMTVEDSTSDEPTFFINQTDLTARAVLTPATDKSIVTGASDSEEMGYFHHGRKNRPVRIDGNFTGVDSLILQSRGAYALEDVVFEGNVEVLGGTLELVRSTIKSLTMNTALSVDANDSVVPVLDAKDCVFDEITVVNSLARLEYCTVMKAANCLQLEASDCIFAGAITNGSGGLPESGCIRYSRIPADFNGSTLNVISGRTSTITREMPIFIKFDYCTGGAYEYRTAAYGEPGYGVLHLLTTDAIRFGAEDGGEMGAYHHKYYSLKAEAVLEKMREFLPVGIEPILIQDTRLLHVPPEQLTLE